MYNIGNIYIFKNYKQVKKENLGEIKKVVTNVPYSIPNNK